MNQATLRVCLNNVMLLTQTIRGVCVVLEPKRSSEILTTRSFPMSRRPARTLALKPGPHMNDLHSCRISCCTSGCTLVKARPNSKGRIQRTVAPSMMKGLPSASGKMQNSSSAPTETATGLATRQPPGERSRSSPSPATIRFFDEKWLRNWTETRTC